MLGWARLKTWIIGFAYKLDQSTPQTIIGQYVQQGNDTSFDSAVLGSELLTSSNWTSVGWTGDFANGFTHTTGDVTPLSNSLAAINATLYQLTYTITNRTAGSISITFGGVTDAGITATGAKGNRTVSTGNLTITPTTDFNGTLVISLKRITGGSNPIQVIKNSSGVVINEIRGNTTNNFNGIGSGIYNTTGSNNSAQGVQALFSNTTGYNNSAQGINALFSNTTGSNNSAQGGNALFSNTTGSYNSAQGISALRNNTTGSYNSAQGYAALYSNTTGSYNSAQGYAAGRYLADGVTANQTPNNSVFLGANTKSKQAGQTNETVIGYGAIGNGSNTVTLGNSSVTDNYLQGRGHFTSSVQIGDDTAAASAANKGATRYREEANASITEMVMKTGASSYTWVEIQRMTW